MTKYKIRTVHKAYDRDYLSTVEINLSRFRPDSWIIEVANELSTLSQDEAYPSAETGYFKEVLNAVLLNAQCREILRRPVSEQDRSSIKKLFTIMETIIDENLKRFADSSKARASSVFRRWLMQIPNRERFNDIAFATQGYFQSRLQERFKPRQILSTIPELDDENKLHPPVDAISHKTIKELKEKIVRRLDLSVDRILFACIKELETWKNVRIKINEFSKQKISKKDLEFVKNCLVNPVFKKNPERYSQRISSSKIFAGASRLCTDKYICKQIGHLSLNSKKLRDDLLKVLELEESWMNGIGAGQIICMRQRIHSRELVAAFIVLLVHTGWNGSSLRKLKRDNIQPEGKGFRIQGFKSKTGDDTPEVFMDKEHPGAILALELLIWNHQQMKGLGLISESEQGLWFTWNNKIEYPMTYPISVMKSPFDAFIAHHGIPKFSFDQIRTHMLVRASANGIDIREIQRKAGHANVFTTSHYINQTILHLQGKAISLEYKRRLDNTIKWQINETRKRNRLSVIAEHIDQNLVMPIGDGTECISPNDPPENSWLNKSGVCNALRCHSKDGCSNNRILMTKDRIEEVFRVEIYYRNNFRRLHEENADAFEQFHGPAMIFNLALVDYIKKSTYWEQVKKILREKKII